MPFYYESVCIVWIAQLNVVADSLIAGYSAEGLREMSRLMYLSLCGSAVTVGGNA